MVDTAVHHIWETIDSGRLRRHANHCERHVARSMLVLVALYLLSSVPIRADELGRKVGPMLKMALGAEQSAAGAGKKTTDGRRLAVILKGDTAALALKVDALGGSVGTIAGDILTAQVPRRALVALMADPALERAEAEPRLRAVNDAARQEINADHIHRDEAALGAAYRGRGVVVGIVDSGIDIFHPDFRDPADSTRSRILAIWDQLDDSGPPPPGYSYGTLYTREDIEAALRGEAAIAVSDELGHGTHVAATAAGNSPVYTGMAPEAELVFVKLLEDLDFGYRSHRSGRARGTSRSIPRSGILQQAVYLAHVFTPYPSITISLTETFTRPYMSYSSEQIPLDHHHFGVVSCRVHVEAPIYTAKCLVPAKDIDPAPDSQTDGFAIGRAWSGLGSSMEACDGRHSGTSYLGNHRFWPLAAARQSLRTTCSAEHVGSGRPVFVEFCAHPGR